MTNSSDLARNIDSQLGIAPQRKSRASRMRQTIKNRARRDAKGHIPKAPRWPHGSGG